MSETLLDAVADTVGGETAAKLFAGEFLLLRPAKKMTLTQKLKKLKPARKRRLLTLVAQHGVMPEGGDRPSQCGKYEKQNTDRTA